MWAHAGRAGEERGPAAGRGRRADEPTGNLDEGTRDEIIALLEKLWKDLGLTLILVTHDSSVARRARDGRLLIRQDVRPGHQAAVTPDAPGGAVR